MAEYVDAVATYVKENKSMVLLQFMQAVPVRKNGEIEIKQEISSSVLMSIELAKAFATGLVEQFSDNSESLDAEKHAPVEN